MFPEGFKSRILTQKYIDSEALLEALTDPSPVSIKLNPRKWTRKPEDSVPVQWAENGFYLESRPSYTLDPLFHAGCYYPQEASSMFIEQVIRQHADLTGQIKVLDLCGAPGGKSLHLSDLIGRNNLLVSNEVIKSRASVLAESLTKWGAANAIVTQSDPSAFGSLPGYFDIILVDAPCSGEGMFRTEVARNEWSVSNTAHCSERQKRILSDIWPALKQNGILIYSTCTFNPGENEENIKWLTENKKSESLSLAVSSFKGIREIDYNGIKGYGFYPDKIRGEGFFISVLRKTEYQEVENFRSRKTTDLRPLRKETEGIKKWTKIPGDRMLKWSNDIWGLPCNMDEYTMLFSNLRIIKAGVRICTIKKDDFLPSHELVMSSELEQNSLPSEEAEYQDAIAFLRRDNLSLRFNQKGWNILKYMGVNMGLINNIGSRLNNYYPIEWRIRMDHQPGINLIKWD